MQVRTGCWILSLVVMTTITCSAYQAMPQTGHTGSNYAQLPLVFEANQGQTDPRVKFLSRGDGYTAFLSAGGIVLSLRPSAVTGNNPSTRTKPSQSSGSTLRLTLVGANQRCVVTGEEMQPGKVNYFIGKNPAKWRTNVPTYKIVRSKNVYPGIDLVYYGNRHLLEYDFEISAGGDPSKIQFEVTGALRIDVDSDGNLVLQTRNGEVRLNSPLVYQTFNNHRTAVEGHYILLDSTHVAFQVSRHDLSRPLVIDPVLVYSTYLGGSGNDQPSGIAVDGAGSVYVTGSTDSIDFPLTTLGSLSSGAPHVVVAKLDATGTNLIYADYLGGNGDDYGYALALDSANNAYVTGSTASSDFPMVNPFLGTYPGAFNAFLTKISPDGSSLLYSTYFGGNGSDIPTGVAVDVTGHMVIAGYTSSTNLPVANAYQAAVSANQGGMYGNYGFLGAFSPDGSSLVYSTYFGGNTNVPLNCGGTPCWPQPSSTIAGVVLDATGNAYIAGTTNTYNFPVTAGAYITADTTQSNASVGFVSKFSAAGNLQYSTYFYEASGLLTDISAITVDSSASAYVIGVALSDGTFPITSTSICDPSVYSWACSYGFVSKFDATGSHLLYSTFLGPNNYAAPRAIALDGNNNAYVLASTGSNLFNPVNGIEGYNNGNDILLVEIDAAADTQLIATYIGGNSDDEPAGMALDPIGNVYVAGRTNSLDFPVTQSVFQQELEGNYDAFIVKIGPGSAAAVAMTPTSLQYAAQTVGSTSQAQTVLVRNMGSSPLTISSTTTTGDFAETDDCGSSVPAAGSCTFSITFTPTAGGQRMGAVTIQDDAAGSPHAISLGGSGLGIAAVTLTPPSLTFPSQPVGTSSSPQTVTLTNSGSATLSLNNVQVTGVFGQTNNCPATVAPGGNCAVDVTFTPGVAGSQSGTLTFTDNSQDSPQAVNLAGSGADFSLASSPTAETIKAGATATYTLSIAPVAGPFPNAIKLSCTGAPAKTTCSLTSSSVTPGSSPATVTLTVSTTATSAEVTPSLPEQNQTLLAVWIQLPVFGLFGLLVVGTKLRSASRVSTKLLAVFALGLSLSALLFMSACAGGTGIAKQTQNGTAPGNYTITVSGTSGALQHSLPLTLTVQ